MRSVRAVALAGLALILSGCADSHDKLAADQIAALKELNTVLDGVEDEASVEAAKGRLEAIGKKLEALQQRQAKLGEPTAEQKRALEERHREEMEREMSRLMANMFRIASQPGVLQKLETAMPRFEPPTRSPPS